MNVFPSYIRVSPRRTDAAQRRAGRRRPAALWMAACMFVVGWSSAIAVQVPTDEPGSHPGKGSSGGAESPSALCKTVTVTGRVFYNDLREDGRFSLRKSQGKGDGHAEPWVANPQPGANANYLGLLDGTVRIYAYNPFYRLNGCPHTALAGQTTIDRTGSYSWRGQVCNNCPGIPAGTPDDSVSLVANVSLQHCGVPSERCFSVRDPKDEGMKGDHYKDQWDGSVWTRWFRGADFDHPRVVKANGVVDLGDNYFQEDQGPVAGKLSDLEAQAASVFASMVDVTRKVHTEGGVPFDHARYGEVKAFFPSVIGGDTGGAHSHQAARLCVGAPHTKATYEPPDLDAFKAWLNGPRTEKYPHVDLVTGDNDYKRRKPETWVRGDEAAHEYGHLVHYWAWGGKGKWGSFCYRDSQCDERVDTPEYTLTAFKEGWASFVAHMTFDEEKDVVNSCAKVESDAHLGCKGPGIASSAICKKGRRYILDVKHALCDLWDSPEETARWKTTAYHDKTKIGIDAMRNALVLMWGTALPDERKDIERASSFGPKNTATAPLDLCRFAKWLPATGAVSTESVKETLGVNGIDCGL